VAAATVLRAEDIRLDGTVVGFAGVLAVASGLVFASSRHGRLARVNVTDALKTGGRAGAGRLHRPRAARSWPRRSRCRSCCSSARGC
jgi:hypothetical protein